MKEKAIRRYEDKKNIKVGNKYHYMFGIYTREGFGECDITITHIRSGVIFYIVDNHPEMAEGHFGINSYMAEHLELISK